MYSRVSITIVIYFVFCSQNREYDTEKPVNEYTEL